MILLDTHYWSYFLFHMTGIHPGEIYFLFERILPASLFIILYALLDYFLTDSIFRRIEALSGKNQSPKIKEKLIIHVHNVYIGLIFSLVMMLGLNNMLLSELDASMVSYDFILISIIIPATYIYIVIHNFYKFEAIKNSLDSVS